jgi:hypothetical protein
MIKVELTDVLILLFILYLTYITFSLEKPKTTVEKIKDKINNIKNESILTKKPENEFLLDDIEEPIIKDLSEQNKQNTTTKPYVEVKNMDQVKNVNMLVQDDNVNMLVQDDNLITIQKLN